MLEKKTLVAKQSSPEHDLLKTPIQQNVHDGDPG